MSSVSSVDGGYQYYQKPLTDLENETQEETKKARERYEERSARLEKKTDEALAKQSKAGEEAADNIRNESAESLARDRANSRDVAERDKALTYDKWGKAQNDAMLARHEADAQVQSAMELGDHRAKKANELSDERLNKLAAAYDDKLTDNAYKDKASREQETSELRDSLHLLANNQGQYLKEKGQGKVDAYRELENEYVTKNNVSNEQHRRQVDALMKKSNDSDQHHAQIMADTQRDRDAYYTQLIRDENEEFQGDRTASLKAEQAAQDAQDQMNKQQQAAEEKKYDDYTTKSEKSKTDALAKQAEIYNNDLRSYRMDANSKQKVLEQELRAQRTSGDDTYISPAAEQKFRDSVMRSYEKNYAAEVERNKARADSQQEGFTKKLGETNQESQQKVYEAAAQHQVDASMERRTYLDSLQETEDNHKMAEKNLTQESESRANHITKTYDNNMEVQRRDLEMQLNDSRNQAQMRINDLRQQAQFDAKMAQKQFATQQAETIRSYEKKLEEQKSQTDYQLASMKEEVAHNHGETERRTKQLLDDQSKGYEQKIAQNEYAAKEHERILTENYQDQIEKLRRSNALIIQRRSEKS